MKNLHRADRLTLSTLVVVAGAFALAAQAASTPPNPTGIVQAVSADSPRWELEANAKPVDYQGRRCLMLDGGAATLKDLELRDGVVDVDVFTPASRGFSGIQFRVTDEGANGEWVYLRQHKSGQSDAMQYTPVLNTGLNWQLYSGPGFTGAVEVPRNEWFHLRLELTGAQARLFVKDMGRAALVMPDLKSGNQKGQVALAVLLGASCFSNFEVRATPDTPWQRQLPVMPAGTLTEWRISPALDALARNLEQPLSNTERDAMPWQAVQAEAPGLVPLYRYRQAPHPRVSFARDWSKRLEPQPGMQVVYARTSIPAECDQVRKLNLGYSDDVSVFLNGQVLYRGRSAQNFRDPAGFLGIMDVENDALYLPLKAGHNELVLAVSELGGGWGFIARLANMPQASQSCRR